jgi:hypothetical protein
MRISEPGMYSSARHAGDHVRDRQLEVLDRRSRWRHRMRQCGRRLDEARSAGALLADAAGELGRHPALRRGPQDAGGVLVRQDDDVEAATGRRADVGVVHGRDIELVLVQHEAGPALVHVRGPRAVQRDARPRRTERHGGRRRARDADEVEAELAGELLDTRRVCAPASMTNVPASQLRPPTRNAARRDAHALARAEQPVQGDSARVATRREQVAEPRVATDPAGRHRRDVDGRGLHRERLIDAVARTPIWIGSVQPDSPPYGGCGGPPGYCSACGCSCGSIRSTTYARNACAAGTM